LDDKEILDPTLTPHLTPHFLMHAKEKRDLASNAFYRKIYQKSMESALVRISQQPQLMVQVIEIAPKLKQYISERVKSKSREKGRDH